MMLHALPVLLIAGVTLYHGVTSSSFHFSSSTKVIRSSFVRPLWGKKRKNGCALPEHLGRNSKGQQWGPPQSSNPTR